MGARTIKARPTVANVAMALADTEYSYALPAGTKEFWLKLQIEGYDLQVAMVSGASGTTYFTVNSGQVHKEPDVKNSGVVLYFRSPQAGMTAQILSFK